MGDYYNKTRGPLSVTLNGGSSCSLPPKSWTYLSPGQETSASVVMLLQKGHLVRAKVARTVESVVPATPATPATPAKKATPVTVAEKLQPVVSEEVAPAVSEEAASTSSMKEAIFRRKR